MQKIFLLFTFIFFIHKVHSVKGMSEQQSQSEEDLDVCVSKRKAAELFKKILHTNDLVRYQNEHVIEVHEMGDDHAVDNIGDKYAVIKFKEYTEDLKNQLRIVFDFIKHNPNNTNMLKIQFCYRLSRNSVAVVHEGQDQHQLTKILLTGALENATKDQYFKTVYELFNTNYQLMKMGYSNIDLGLHLANQDKEFIQYIYNPLRNLAELPVNLDGHRTSLKMAPEAINQNIKNEQSIVYEGLFLWMFFELKRQKQEQLYTQLSQFGQKAINEQGVSDLREFAKSAFQQVYKESHSIFSNSCTMDKLIDQVIVYDSQMRLNFEDFLKCFKQAVSNSQQKATEELI